MTVLLTGITGLVGCHVAISLLKRGVRVIALARGGDGATPEQRVMRTLTAFPGWQGKQGSLSNVLAAEGDLLAAACGMDEGMCAMLNGHVDVVLNCAGAISFSAPGEETPELRVNTDGLVNVMDLSARLGCRRIIHVSTAYVDKGYRDGAFRTEYERTKKDGEQLLLSRASERELDAIIVRPSIVTGDCRFGFTPVFNGIYPFFRFISDRWFFLQNTSTKQWMSGAFSESAAVNLVPAGILGDVLSELVEAWPAGAKIFSLINPNDWSIPDLLEATAAHFHKHPPPSGTSVSRAIFQMAAVQAEARVLFDLYEPYAAASPRLMADSEAVLLSPEASGALENRDQWLQALLDWGMTVGWKRVG